MWEKLFAIIRSNYIANDSNNRSKSKVNCINLNYSINVIDLCNTHQFTNTPRHQSTPMQICIYCNNYGNFIAIPKLNWNTNKL